MALKIVLEFVQQTDGWTEVYVQGGSAPATYLVVAANGEIAPNCPAFLLLASRLNLLHPINKVVRLRVSVIGTPRTTKVISVSTAQGTGLWPGTVRRVPGSPAEVHTKVLLRATVGTLRVANIWLGGVPEQLVSAPQTFMSSGAWTTNFSILKNVIFGGNYGINGRNSAITVPVAQPITAFTPGGNANTTATLSPVPTGAPVAGYYYVTIRGIHYPRKWNGLHKATAGVAPGTIVIGPTRKSQVAVPTWDVGSGGTVQLYTPVFSPFDGLSVDYLSNRRVGRPFGLLRGRTP